MAYREYNDRNGNLRRTRHQGYRYAHKDISRGLEKTNFSSPVIDELRIVLGKDEYKKWFTSILGRLLKFPDFTMEQVIEEAREKLIEIGSGNRPYKTDEF